VLGLWLRALQALGYCSATELNLQAKNPYWPTQLRLKNEEKKKWGEEATLLPCKEQNTDFVFVITFFVLFCLFVWFVIGIFFLFVVFSLFLFLLSFFFAVIMHEPQYQP
jgi:hypothetical protein